MAENSKIEWCDHTFNPWEGCTKVSPGCNNCYAEARSHRYGMDNWGKGKPRRRTSEANWKKPLKWNRESLICPNGSISMGGAPGGHGPYSVDGKGDCPECGAKLRRPRVFCASLADWLDDEVSIEWLADLLKLIHDTPNLDWLNLSKRPENFWERVGGIGGAFKWWADNRTHDAPEFMNWLAAWLDGHPPSNVWIGTTCEDQKRADERIPHLLKIPAKVRFLSCEPLIGPVEFSDVTNRSDAVSQLGKPAMDGIHWVIVGSESGAKRRSMQTEWAMSIRQECDAAGVAFSMKQMEVEGKVTGDMERFPAALQRREFPETEQEALVFNERHRQQLNLFNNECEGMCGV